MEENKQTSRSNLKAELEASFVALPESLSTNQVAQMTNTSPESFRLWRYAQRKGLSQINYGPRALKAGRRVFYLKSDVIEWLVAEQQK